MCVASPTGRVKNEMEILKIERAIVRAMCVASPTRRVKNEMETLKIERAIVR